MTTIRQQLTRKLLITVGLLIAAGGFGVYFFARTALLSQFDAALRAKAEAITSLTEQKGNGFEFEFSDEHMRNFESGGNDFFELRHANEDFVERSPSMENEHLPLHHGTTESPTIWNLKLPNGQAGRAIGMRFHPQALDEEHENAPPAEALLVVASVRRDLDRTLMTLQMVLAGCGLLLLATTALVVPQVLRSELTPLQHLANEAARIDASSLSARFSCKNLPGELSPIAARLNELLARLENSFERERHFSSDVAHEFRTPVAELRSLAELAIKLPDARPANADEEVLAIALHLEAMLKHLLTLARGEQNQLPVQKEFVKLAPLIQDVCEYFKAKAAARQLILSCRADAASETETDPALLRSILANLVVNAVEYAPGGDNIEVELCANHNGFTVRVINTVENLDARDLPHLFERFWRKNMARSPDGHTGLGLPLARIFAQSLGCELTADFIAPGRLALILTSARCVV